MRALQRIFGASLILTAVLLGSFWYYSAAAVCRYPITYQLGELDPRFDLTYEEARLAIHDAEALWEQGLNKHLFRYAENGRLVVNFVFDDRQELSNEQREARDQLESLQAQNVELMQRFNRLVAEHEARKEAFVEANAAYEARLAEYNAEVASFSQAGGAPPTDFARLQAEQRLLQAESRELNTEARAINELTNTINDLGRQGNQLVEQYNQRVAQYNTRFGEQREFTQGDYRGGEINIYTFSSQLELRQVLAHELGHALSLEHVDDPQAIMYHLMGTQPDELLLTPADLAEFARVCGNRPGWYRFWRGLFI